MIKKAYFIRHGAEGLLTDRVFLVPPSDTDMNAARERMRKKHGFGHPKYNDPESSIYQGDDHPSAGDPWPMSVEETCLIIPDQITSLTPFPDGTLPPDPREVDPQGRPVSVTAEVAVPIVASVATGRVINPGDPDHPLTTKE